MYTVRMKAGQSQAKFDGDKFDLWQKTSYANLVRYNPSGTYFCRVRVRGKLILELILEPTVAQISRCIGGRYEIKHLNLQV